MALCAPLIRPAAVSGLFYPEDAQRLREDVDTLLMTAAQARPTGRTPRALIVPHAGYIYSGAAAAAAYAAVPADDPTLRRVVLLGPPHRVPVPDIAGVSHTAFRTPLGEIGVDRDALGQLERMHGIAPRDDAHTAEHSLEVQLPFLQRRLPSISIVPLLVATDNHHAVAATLAPLWADPHTLIVVSTDLSHFLTYAEARARDAETDRRIMQLDAGILGPHDACGCRALNGLLALAREKRASIERLALHNSGDTAGDRQRVVGYAAYALF